jgi:general secretion pathway protein I
MRGKSPQSPIGEPIAAGRRDSEGFTLLEVLVALTILSISLAVLMGVFSQGLSRARDMRDDSAARALAQSLIAEHGDAGELAIGDFGGQDGAFTWQLHTAPFGSQELGTPHMALLTASVTWKGGKRTVSLSTLRLMPKTRAQ